MFEFYPGLPHVHVYMSNIFTDRLGNKFFSDCEFNFLPFNHSKLGRQPFANLQCDCVQSVWIPCRRLPTIWRTSVTIMSCYCSFWGSWLLTTSHSTATAMEETSTLWKCRRMSLWRRWDGPERERVGLKTGAVLITAFLYASYRQDRSTFTACPRSTRVNYSGSTNSSTTDKEGRLYNNSSLRTLLINCLCSLQ